MGSIAFSQNLTKRIESHEDPRSSLLRCWWISQRELKVSCVFCFSAPTRKNLTKRIERAYDRVLVGYISFVESHKENWKEGRAPLRSGKSSTNLTKRIESMIVEVILFLSFWISQRELKGCTSFPFNRRSSRNLTKRIESFHLFLFYILCFGQNLTKRIESRVVDLPDFYPRFLESHKENWKRTPRGVVKYPSKMESHKENWKSAHRFVVRTAYSCESHKENWKMCGCMCYKPFSTRISQRGLKVNGERDSR